MVVVPGKEMERRTRHRGLFAMIWRILRHLEPLVRPVLKPWVWTFDQYPPRPLTPSRGRRGSKNIQHSPSIAIVTPALNHGNFIKAAIDSILSQGYPALDYIVKDAGSSDGTCDILRVYGPGLKWISEPDSGQTNAINAGFRHVTGEIMGWLNSDDLLLPGALRAVASFFQSHPDIDIVYGDRIIIDTNGHETGRIVLPPYNSDVLRRIDYIPQETMFWRRRVWEALNGLDETFQFSMDWDFLLRAQGQGFRFQHLPRFLGAFRIHPLQKTQSWKIVGESEQSRLRRTWVGPNFAVEDIKGRIWAYFVLQNLWQYGYRLGAAAAGAWRRRGADLGRSQAAVNP
jgi:glycosyltransferase involved in cell wall biosynthesis